MSYRRLPNTDNARMLAILKLEELLLAEEVAVLRNHKETIKSLKIIFEKLIKNREQFLLKRASLNKKKRVLLNKLKLYVSHFLQVFNFAIDRKDIAKEGRIFFGLETYEGVTPSLSKETDIIKWANNIVKGEQKRLTKGIETISHPNFVQIKEIAAAAERIIEELKGLEKLFKKDQLKMQEQRIEIDQFIKQMWNEIEFQFVNEPINIKRKKAAQYGVVYVG